MIEFVNGKKIVVEHPEAVAYYREIAMYRKPVGEFQVFSADSVCRIYDPEAEEELDLS